MRRDRRRSPSAAPLRSAARPRAACPTPERARHRQRPAERLHAVGQSAQAGAAGRVSPAEAVVGNAHDQPRGRSAATPIRAPDASAYLATLAKPSEHTKNAAASCGPGKRRRGTSRTTGTAAWSASSPSAAGGRARSAPEDARPVRTAQDRRARRRARPRARRSARARLALPAGASAERSVDTSLRPRSAPPRNCSRRRRRCSSPASTSRRREAATSRTRAATSA